MKRPSIALACIMKNEEENLPILFESIKDCFDEVHITDTGSTDNSVSVAENLGAKVKRFEWVHDFAAARNFSFANINTDYTMWLDLDDSLNDAKSFIDFRDNLLSVSDFWLATYNYAFNADKIPVCQFSRERIIRNGRGFHWKYFLHEGLLHDGSIPVSVQFTRSFSVDHRRTEKDLSKDKGRNLLIFEKNLGQIDARMRYYYGKELFEAARVKESLTHLGEALKSPDLEPHDRIVCAQYACYALMQLDKYDEALSMALTNLQLAPNRAEYLALIGDCYIKKGNPVAAIPYFEAAKSCPTTDYGKSFSPVFQTADAYTVYPGNQISRIRFHTGDVEGAKKEAKECFDRYKNPETKLLLDEFDRFDSIVTSVKAAKACEDIVFTCPMSPYEWNPEIYKKKSMGGSETACIEMAKWIAHISGRPVKVFNSVTKRETFNGVEYIPFTEKDAYFTENKPYIHIAWRHNLRLTEAPTFLWCHDLFTQGAEAHQNYIKHICLTPFHKKYAISNQGIPEGKIYLSRNGIVPERFEGGPWEKDPFRFVFGSSPDRGLERTIRVLRKVRETYPEVNLHVFYGVEHLGNYGHSELRDRLLRTFEENKEWLTYHGATEQQELMKWYKSAAYNIQPSDWVETSCISALELVGCGVYPIFRHVGGVADTLQPFASRGLASLVPSNCVTESEHQVYVDEVLRCLGEKRHERLSLVKMEGYSWESVAREWMRDLPEFIK